MRIRRAAGVALLCALGFVVGGAAPRFDDIDRWVKAFDDPERDGWQKPDVVVRFLALEGGEFVADLGAGTGYFTVHLARAVGARGRVFAVDIERKFVDYVRERATAEGLPQVLPVLARRSDPKLPAGRIDRIFVCNTWHHIDRRDRYLKRLARALKPGGKVIIVDFREGDLPIGPPPAHKLSRQQVLDEFARGGFRLVEESTELPYQYLLAFEIEGPRDRR